MRFIFRISSVVCMVLFFLSCNKEEPIPAYIHIDKIDLITDATNEGSNSHKIMDAWIYVDDQLVGAFEMPCTVPVLYEGEHTIKILPGIKENGIAETRIVYPFYFRYEATLTLTAGEVTTLSPVVTYSDGADFSWIEEFEVPSIAVCDSGASDTAMIQTSVPSEVFEGAGSGAVTLPTGVYYGISCSKYILPKLGAPVFIELDYKCNSEFNVGVVGYSNNNLVDAQLISLTLRPTTEWNKVYVNITNEISSTTNSVKYAVFFSMLKNPDVSTSTIYVDNIKLIH